METFNNILVVSRSTQNCVKVLRAGISLARKYGSNLHLLHVIYDPFYFNGWNFPVSSYDEEIQKEVKKVREELDSMVAAEKSEGLHITEWIELGKPSREIKKVVEEANIDLVLMLAHQEGRMEHFLFGRTNEAVIRDLPATLMLVK